MAADSARRHPRNSVRSQRRAGGRIRLRAQRRWVRIRRSFGLMRTSRRTRRARQRVGERGNWRGSRPLVKIVKVASAAGGIVLLVLLAGAAYSVISGRPSGFMAAADRACNGTSASCNILAGTLGPLLSLALASAIFLLVRLWLVRRPYVRRAREQPEQVVETAGSMIGEVVGRDELCHVMIENLRDPGIRRPHVVVGDVGTGKTALLVRLTELLAERRAVPVPVRLRDAQESLDFRELARKRFVAAANRALRSDAEGEKVWRELCKNDQIVVLADGLEEALSEGNAQKERNSLIRLAIRQANEHRLPLIIASRPHDPLRDMDAAIIELEPLSEEAALEYVQERKPGEDIRRLDWIVETADVAEAPLYLQVTRQLRGAGLMEHVTRRSDGRRLDTRGVDRAELRLRLLETWTQALIDGHYTDGHALSREDRMATVEQLSLMACIGLQRDQLQVRFDDVEVLRRNQQLARIFQRVNGLLQQLGRFPDLRLAAAWGTRLGLVEARGDGIRFPHSIMQAYLASRLIDAAMADETYRRDALSNSGREFLIALVMHSRARRVPHPDGVPPASSGQPPLGDPPWRNLLCAEAAHRTDVKALDLYSAALQIDCVEDKPAHGEIAEELARRWRDVRGRDQRTLEEAKLNLVRRFGEAARMIAERRRTEPELAEPAYRQLYQICCSEPSYPIRLEGAQEIGAGGDEAFAALEDILGPRGRDPGDGRPAASSRAGTFAVGTSHPGLEQAQEEDEEERAWREGVLRAWLAPLLVGSVTERAQDARRNLDQWLEFIGEPCRTKAEADLRLSLGVTLAQGFKHAANRRQRHPHARQEARDHLAERAREMLRETRFWFSRLTLLHALCLWSLTDGPRQPSGSAHEAEYRAQVSGWLTVADSGAEHPFVAEARELAVLALETGQPERFIWIDESGVVGRIGSRPANPRAARKHNLWIPPSTGWTALHPRAQQLVADVLLLLNLAERGARPSNRNSRLSCTHRDDLPPCLAGDRSPLDPARTIGMAGTSKPGSNCRHGCPFELCPYPPQGEAYYRAELREPFCRRQQALVGRGSLRRRTAWWQATLPGELRRFWKQMGQRAQPTQPAREPRAARTVRRRRPA